MFIKIVKAIAIVIVLVAGGAVTLLSVQLGGIRAFVVQSASMEPTITTGSLAITKSTSPGEIAPNDIVTFIRPDKSREFITHRILEKFDNKGAIVFKTKGDNNDNQDGWLLAGGGIVGKVILTIPYLGYLLSLARTKIGIALLIVIPAIGIIVDEIITMARLIRNRKKPLSKALPITGIIILIGCTAFLVQGSLAALTSSVTLVDNTFSVPSVLPTPSPSPSPSPSQSPSGCGGNVSITISGNGTDSSSSVNINTTCISTTSSTNNANISTTVDSQADTGGNIASGNTGGATSINTGDASSSVSITTEGNLNQ